MRRRPAVTLLEVLVALFIMAIGMLALLVLFPLGAFSMGKALKDDRCASAASMAEQMAIVANVRHDPNLIALYTTGLNQAAYPSGPSLPLYVDPYSVSAGMTTLGSNTGNTSGVTPIQRVSPVYASSSQLIDRFFSLPNDITFLPTTGTPDLTYGNVVRGRAYSWAYMLRRPQVWSDQSVDLTVVMYYNRSTTLPPTETTYPVADQNTTPPLQVTSNPRPMQGASTLVLNYASAENFRRGMWLMDISPITGTAIPRSDFYRITNVDDLGQNGGVSQVALDIQPNLICDGNPAATVTYVVGMDDVAEVFPKGTSWHP